MIGYQLLLRSHKEFNMPRPRLKNLLPSPTLKFLVALLIVFALAGGIWYGVWVIRNREESVPPLSEEETGEIPSTQPNLKVAFIGDSGYGGILKAFFV